MNTQSEALRLAEWLQANYEADEIDQAADLLRKLFADKEKLERLLTTSANCERRLHALNAELLEALKECQEAFEIASDGGGVNFYEYVLSIKAKINRYKTEGELK